MGLLVINATINSAPLKVLVRIARIGAIWQMLGWFLQSPMCVRNIVLFDLFLLAHTVFSGFDGLMPLSILLPMLLSYYKLDLNL